MADEFIPPLDRPTVSVKMARQLLGDIGHDKVWRMIREGELKVVKIGRRTLVRTDSIKALLGMKTSFFGN